MTYWFCFNIFMFFISLILEATTLKRLIVDLVDSSANISMLKHPYFWYYWPPIITFITVIYSENFVFSFCFIFLIRFFIWFLCFLSKPYYNNITIDNTYYNEVIEKIRSDDLNEILNVKINKFVYFISKILYKKQYQLYNDSLLIKDIIL